MVYEFNVVFQCYCYNELRVLHKLCVVIVEWTIASCCYIKPVYILNTTTFQPMVYEFNVVFQCYCYNKLRVLYKLCVVVEWTIASCRNKTCLYFE